MNIKLEHVLLFLLFVLFLKMIRDKCCCRLTEGYFGEAVVDKVDDFNREHPYTAPIVDVGVTAGCLLGGCEVAAAGGTAFMVGDDIAGGETARDAFVYLGSE